jgi:transcriptional regulator
MNTKQEMEVLDLTKLSMAALVNMVNALGGSATMKTFSQRSKAQQRVLSLAEATGVNLLDVFDAEGNKRPEPTAEELAAEKKAREEIARVEKLKAEEKPKAEAKPKKEKGESIRAFAECLLMEVVSKDKDGRKVGHSYATILEKIKERYEGAKTSVACLRWYAVHMREAGKMPPTRPRAMPTKPDTAAAEQKPEA